MQEKEIGNHKLHSSPTFGGIGNNQRFFLLFQFCDIEYMANFFETSAKLLKLTLEKQNFPLFLVKIVCIIILV
jgi:hypothetical protein